MSGIFRDVLAKLKQSVGASLVGFDQACAGAVLRTMQSKSEEQLSVFDFMTGEQILDVRSGTFAMDLTVPMNQAAAEAGAKKRALHVPSGGYKMTGPWVIPPQVHVIGEGFGMQTAYDPGATWLYGVMIYKAHTGNAITKTGTGPYTPGAPIENISVTSDRTAFAGGNGFVLDKVSTCHLIRCNAFGIGGDCFVLGVSEGDVTGHNYTFNCYSNNPVGVHYRIRQKWGRYQYPVGDGGTIGMFFDAAPMSEVDGFHFEGFTQVGIKVSNGSTNVVLAGRGYLGHTTAGVVTGIQVTNEAGNSGFVAENIYMSGTGIAGCIGVQLFANAINAKVLKCTFSQWDTGVSTSATYANSRTVIDNCYFYQNGLPIYAAGDNTFITNNGFDGTIGAYTINHVAGTRGMWSGNTFDKAPNPALSGVQGNYSGICVKNNAGFVTRKSGSTAAITAYTNIPHGLAGAPKYPLVLTCNSSGVTSFPQIAAIDATNFQLYWTGTANVQWNWEAACPCDF
jgi:hypothetical protein